MKTPVLDSLTIKREKERIETWLHSRDLIEIQRDAPENSEISSSIKSLGVYAFEDWKNWAETCEFIFFETRSGDIRTVNAWIAKGGTVWTWIAADQFGEIAGPERALEYLLKEF